MSQPSCGRRGVHSGRNILAHLLQEPQKQKTCERRNLRLRLARTAAVSIPCRREKDLLLANNHAIVAWKNASCQLAKQQISDHELFTSPVHSFTGSRPGLGFKKPLGIHTTAPSDLYSTPFIHLQNPLRILRRNKRRPSSHPTPAGQESKPIQYSVAFTVLGPKPFPPPPFRCPPLKSAMAV
ncbi:hypothetical protein BCR34DRAFT_317019 [Clohesyomyces aquaticus]|uniref:Uncharacterized protein n=1 Tax=Clohesyomyces aquaticus TaxID=1231657 RepID=A0A1Y1ZNA0_9PLEO|nr:hypothetical protein BCR34DRAFT_317019 [Clohesyomyces aquaticus]